MTVRIEPMDLHNEKLLENVHPATWQNPDPSGRYNMVVVGGGTAGLVTAAICAGLGAKVALIERHLLGGDCLNVGCVPSKAIISSSRLVAACQTLRELGAQLPEDAHPDFGAVMERMRSLRSGISPHDSAKRFSEIGVDVYFGDACFKSRTSIEVGGKLLQFKKAVIATGARAAVPPIEGLDAAGFLTNETVFSLTERPSDLLVIGGGPIGCELSQAFQRMGSRVTIVEGGTQFLSREDPDAAAIIAHTFQREGIRVMLSTQVTRVNLVDGRKVVHLQRDGVEETLPVDQILVGVGRSPNVEGLGLEIAGVEYDTRAGVKVNDALQTTNPAIYAAGDVCSAYKFTHTADFAARIVVQNTLFPFLPKKKFSALTIPWCTYTDPEIAHVGAYERELESSDRTFETIFVPLGSVDRAILEGETDGFLKMHVDARGLILGATLVSPHAGDMISEITLAMVSKLTIGALGNTIHPYPTEAEIMRKAADAYNRKRLTPGRQRLLAWLLARMR